MKNPLSASRPACLLLGVLVSTTFASDVSFYGVAKEKLFLQSNASAPTLASGGAFRFSCFVDSTAPNLIFGATLGLPSGGSVILSPDGSESWFFEAQFDSASQMNATYTAGTYNLTVESENDDISFAQLDMPTDAYPGAPFVTNFVAAQSIDADADFTLRWSGFLTGTTSDFIQVEIRDPVNDSAVFRSVSQPGGPGALNGTDTSIVIPGGTLVAGQTYDGQIFFAKLVASDMTSIPGAQGVLAFLARTTFTVQAGAPNTPVEIYGVFKAQNFQQTNDSVPVFPTNEPPFRFQSFVDTASNALQAADVQLPGGSLVSLGLEGDGQSWAFEQGFTTEAALDASYPAGPYTMRLSQGGGVTNVVPLSLPADAYPTTPQILNYATAQSIDPSNNFTLSWSAFGGGTSNDFVLVEIESASLQTVLESGAPGQPGALNGTSTSLVIPAHTLSPGETYALRLMFLRVGYLDETSIPGALGVAGLIKRTAATLRTTGTPFAIRLRVMGMVDGHFQFQFNSDPGKAYQIQWSEVLPTWQDLWFTNATGNEVIFTDPFPIATQRFYRVQAQ